ncbi:glucans biosynthesis glucosyltransferase MdoH [Ponticoccus gilvus]|nr:glucans biosynthesis glucosyltransferase MdoH [Enemella evansiae]
MPAPLPASSRTRVVRSIAIGVSLSLALVASGLLFEASLQDGMDWLDWFRAVLILITTAWLAWGASLAFAGLAPARPRAAPQITGAQPATVLLMPICNEDPVATFSRLAAIDRSLAAEGLSVDLVVLSDTREPFAAAREREAFAQLRAKATGQGRIYYRQRSDGRGRKAGNVEEFFRRAGGRYEFAVILDADSLMTGAAIRQMIARMMADPSLGLLQTLPRIVFARSFFGRAMQFAASFHGAVFSRGLARMQGATGPFWGHNAIVRVRAFAESCGLPELPGKAPFGGHILSHDYVEAALLARNGWRVEVDPQIDGSYEEGPENLYSYARRDRRWCQGNLQHMRLLFAPGLAPWSRFVFLQGILSYLVCLLWAGFVLASLAASIWAVQPDYFPEPHQLFPVFPSDRSKEITALFLGIVCLLILPKFAIWAEAALSGRARAYGGSGLTLAAVLTEILLSSLLAPVMLMYQTRAVLQVLSGQDGGWPANARGEGFLTVAQAWRGSLWIVALGMAGLGIVGWFAPAMTVWMLPILLPLIVAPWLIALSSRRLTRAVFGTPEETDPPAILTDYTAILEGWSAPRDRSETVEGSAAHVPA